MQFCQWKTLSVCWYKNIFISLSFSKDICTRYGTPNWQYIFLLIFIDVIAKWIVSLTIMLLKVIVLFFSSYLKIFLFVTGVCNIMVTCLCIPFYFLYLRSFWPLEFFYCVFYYLWKICHLQILPLNHFLSSLLMGPPKTFILFLFNICIDTYQYRYTHIYIGHKIYGHYIYLTVYSVYLFFHHLCPIHCYINLLRS